MALTGMTSMAATATTKAIDDEGADPRPAIPGSRFERVSVTALSQEEMLPQTPSRVEMA